VTALSGTTPLNGVAFVGTHLPRRCGIATFTTDLADAVARRLSPQTSVSVTVVNDTPTGYRYPGRVDFQIQQEHGPDYVRAAEFINESDADVVCIQHEFGIFGGDGGEHVLSLIKRLRKPVVVTCHTVPEFPIDNQEFVLRGIVKSAARVVVMSERARSLITSRYGAEPDKVAVIPHGVHPFPFVEPDSHKGRLHLCGRNVLLTFGLLHRHKGIEHMIDAMPEVLEHHPDACYVVLGATHPVVKRDEGESYRESLVERVYRMGLSDHVHFQPDFVVLPRLLEFIGAADVCVMPYLALEQATSGVLAYAMAMGRAVVSTPTRYATEMLAEGRGRIVPPGNPSALADEIIGLLADERGTMMMRRRAYGFGRLMTWPVVGSAYVRLFEEVTARPRPGIRPHRAAATVNPDGRIGLSH
jgi:glycosyltransferase involved in cell wall biosynthesis